MFEKPPMECCICGNETNMINGSNLKTKTGTVTICHKCAKVLHDGCCSKGMISPCAWVKDKIQCGDCVLTNLDKFKKIINFDKAIV